MCRYIIAYGGHIHGLGLVFLPHIYGDTDTTTDTNSDNCAPTLCAPSMIGGADSNKVESSVDVSSPWTRKELFLIYKKQLTKGCEISTCTSDYCISNVNYQKTSKFLPMEIMKIIKKFHETKICARLHLSKEDLQKSASAAR